MRRLLAPMVFALALPVPARADDAPAGGDQPPKDPPVKVTTFALPHPDVSEDVMVQVMRALETGLKKNERLEMRDLDARLADFSNEVPQEQVDAARAAMKAGQDALLNLDVPGAVQKLQEAVDGLAKVLPYIKKQELADAMANLAVAYYEGGDKRSGRDTFVRLLTWRADYAYPIDKLPPKYAATFEEAQRTVDKAVRGSLEIVSDPPGAQAYVDGRYIGITPCSTDGQPAGEHFVTFKKEGFKKAVAAAMVSKKPQKVTVQLSQSEKYLLVQQAQEKIEPSLGQDMLAAEGDDLKQVLGIDHAVFVKASGKGDKIQVDCYLYDLRTRRRLSTVKKTVPRAELEAQIAQLPSSIYLNVNYEPELVAKKDDLPVQQKQRTPVYKAWWFWTATAAVLAAGAGVAIAIVETRKPGCPDGDSCLSVNTGSHSAALLTFP